MHMTLFNIYTSFLIKNVFKGHYPKCAALCAETNSGYRDVCAPQLAALNLVHAEFLSLHQVLAVSQQSVA